MPETRAAVATELVNRIREAIQGTNFDLPHQPIQPISFSIGLAVYPQHARTFSELVRAADQALYQSKNSEYSTLVYSGKTQNIDKV